VFRHNSLHSSIFGHEHDVLVMDPGGAQFTVCLHVKTLRLLFLYISATLWFYPGDRRSEPIQQRAVGADSHVDPRSTSAPARLGSQGREKPFGNSAACWEAIQ
jgi:hypothetical protein